MNAPVLLAQLSGSPQTSSSKNLKLEKPQNGQAVSVHLDGNTKLDFADVASEKLTFVRVGEKLIILFDNQSTVTVDPVFDSSGKPLADLAFDMGQDRTLSGDQFAQLFPITTDQSVLPAAGGATGPTGGANFSAATVGALGAIGTPLDLLTGEDTGAGGLGANQDGSTVAPIVSQSAIATINEDALSGGNPGGTGDTGGVLVFTGSLNVDFGSDAGGRQFQFGTTQPAGLSGLTSDGQAVHLLVTTSGGQPFLIGYVGNDANDLASRVFTVSLDNNPINGEYTFTLLRPIDHPLHGAVEDTVNLTVNIIAIDGSGDIANTSIQIGINDDTPVIGTTIGAALTDPLSGAPATQSGSLGISWGADRYNDHVDGGVSGLTGDVGDRSVVFSNAQVTVTGTSDGLNSAIGGLTSNGETVHYVLVANGTALIGYTGETAPTSVPTGEVGSNIVFVVTLSDASNSGSYVVTQYQTLDHVSGDQTFSSINLSFQFTATDSDGDSVSGTLNTAITDTVPTLGESVAQHTVGEDGLSAANPTGPEGGFDAVNNSSVTGALHINWGADSDTRSDGDTFGRTLSFLTNGETPTAIAGGSATIGNLNLVISGEAGTDLTSGGVSLQYVVTANADGGETLTAYKGAPGESNAVFTLTLEPTSANGSYTFTLIGELDHASNSNSISLNFTVQAADADGDTVNTGFVINVEDDVPTLAGNVESHTVGEDGLADANINGGSFDAVENASVGGTLNVNWGADNDTRHEDDSFGRTLSFLTNNETPSAIAGSSQAIGNLNLVISGEAGTALTSGGVALQYVVTANSDGGETLTAYKGAPGEGNPVFTLTLDPTSEHGSYTFTLLGQLDHGAESNSIGLTFAVQAADADGDVINTSLVVNVQDDTPVAHVVTSATVLDDEAQTVFAGNNTPADGVPNTNVAHGNAGTLFTAGADGTKSVTISGGEFQVVYKDASGFAQTESVTWGAGVQGGDGSTTFTATSTHYTGTEGSSVAATLVIGADGSYTYTASAPVVQSTSGTTEENATIQVDFTVTDGDGDTAAGSLSVNVNDDTPVAHSVTASRVLDDEAQSVFTPTNSGTGFLNLGDVSPNYSSVTGAAGSLFTAGADGVKAVTLSTAPAFNVIYKDAQGFAQQETIAWGTGVTDANGHTTFTATSAHYTGAMGAATLVVGTDGSYTLTLSAPLVQANQIAGIEENKTLSFGVTVTDGDGDQATATLRVDVNDDTPVPVASIVFASQIMDDEAQTLFTPVNNGGIGDVSPNVGTVSGGAGALFTMGADGLGSLSVGLPSFNAIYQVDGFAKVESVEWSNGVRGTGGVTTFTATGSASGNTVGVLVIKADGSYSFTLSEPVAHDLQLPGIEDTKTLTFTYTAKDGDGDAAVGSLSVSVNDDTPTAKIITASTVLDDEAQTVFTGNAGGAGDVDDAKVAHGDAGALFSAGADGVKSVSISGGAFQVVYKDTNGFALTENVTWGSGVKDASGNTTFTATSTHYATAATLVIGADGSYTYTASAPVVQATSGTTEENATIKINFTVTDGDGDTAAGSLSVIVNDDVPVTHVVTAATVLDDEAQTVFAGNNTPADGVTNTNGAHGNAGTLFTAGADGVKSVTISGGAFQVVYKDANGFALTESVTWGAGVQGVDGSTTFKATSTHYTGTGGSSAAATLVIGVDGSYTYTAFAPVVQSTSGTTEENATIKVDFTVTDGDGDTAAGSLSVDVNDDTPVAHSVTASRVLDDEAQTVFTPTNPGTGFLNLGDVSPNYNSVQGNAGSLFTAGADGVKAVTLSTAPAFAVIYKDAQGFAQQEGTTWGTGVTDANGHTTFTATSAHYTGAIGGAATLVVGADGSYTLTLSAPLVQDTQISGIEENKTLSFGVTVTDGDGDKATATLRVDVNDDTPAPIASIVFASYALDDEAQGLFPANDTPADGVANNKVVTGAAGTLFSMGADGLGSLSVALPSFNVIYNAGGFAKTESVTWGAGMRGADGTTTFTATSDHYTGTGGTGVAATLVIKADGSYSFAVNAPIVQDLHIPGVEDSKVLTFLYTVTDGDGDSAGGTLSVTVNDDTPVAKVVTSATVLDDEAQTVFAGNAGGTGDVDDAKVAHGDAGSLFTAGADGLKSVSISGGVFQVIYKDANGLAHTESVTWGAGVTDASGHTTFTAVSGHYTTAAMLVIGADGSYTYTASAPVVQGTSGTTEENATIKINFTVTDGDGDTSTGSLSVNINDDTPVGHVVTAATVLDDDAFTGGNAGGTGDVENATSVSGAAGSLFSSGADGFKSVTLGMTTAFSAIYKDVNGVAHQETVSWGSATVSGGATIWTATGDISHLAVATLTVNADGSYTFTTFKPLVHPTSSTTEENLALTLNYTVTDSDNDTAAGSLTVNVNDDAPTTAQAYRYNVVNESALSGGATSDTHSFTVNFGADGYGATAFTGAVKLDIGGGLAGNVSFNLAAGEYRSTQFTSDGRAITFKLVDDNTIRGYVASADNGGHGDESIIQIKLTDTDTSATTTLYGNLDHIAAQDGSAIGTLLVDATVKFTDGDGDSVTSIIRTTINDDVPTASYSGTSTIQEDGSASGTFITQAASGTLAFHAGGDGGGVTNVAYRTTIDQEDGTFPALKSHGQDITVTTSLDGLTVTGMVGTTLVFTFVVTNAQTGAYAFTQYQSIDHPDAGVSSAQTGAADYLRLVFDFTVTDGDGDKTAFNAGTVQVDIRDDGPTASWLGAAAVTEDATASGTFISSTSTGTLVFDVGADGGKVTDVVYRFGSSIMYPGGFPALTSHGDPVTIATVKDGAAFGGQGSITLTGSTPDGHAVFTLVVNQVTGAYTYTLSGPLDHPVVGQGGTADALTMVFDFQVTDGDGDKSAAFNEGMLQIDIRDDTPVLVGAAATGTVDETSTPLVQVAYGSLHIDMGADKVGAHLDFATQAGGVPVHPTGLTSDGVALEYQLRTTVDGEKQLVAFKAGDAIDHPVFIVALTSAANANYVFTLFQNLDHAVGSNTLDLSFTVRATDGDGDYVDRTFDVNVTDSVPTIPDHNTQRVGVQDDALAGGNPETGDTSIATGTLSFNYGADSNGHLGWTSTTLPTGGYSSTVTNNLVTVYQLQDGVNVKIFTVTLDTTTGAYTVQQFAAVHHPNGAGELGEGFNINYQVTDGDGDTVDSLLRVVVGDDVPVIVGQTTGSDNLLTDGNFASGSFPHLESWGGWATDGTGWKISGTATGQTGVQLERVVDGYNGMHASNGAPMVDLEASPGDIAISQTVNGLTAGQHYTLSFEIGAANPSSAGLQVYWNGVLIHTYQPTGAMAVQTLDLTAIAGANDITFKEVGSVGDNTGTYLANVSLVQAGQSALPMFHTDISEDGTSVVTLVNGTDYKFGADGPGSVAIDTAHVTISTPTGTTLGVPTLSFDPVTGHLTVNPGWGFGGLSEGEIATLSVPFTVTDSDGDTTTAVYQFTIHGHNDPVSTSIGFPDTGTMTEYAENDVQAGSMADRTRFTDSSWGGGYNGGGFWIYDDQGDSHTVTVTPQETGYIGYVTAVVSQETINDGNGFVDWQFHVTDAQLNPLGAGETMVEVFRITVDDGHGSTTYRDITVTLVGTNDSPVITSSMSAAQGTLGEAGDLSQVVEAGLGGALHIAASLAANATVTSALGALDGHLTSLPSQANVHDALVAIAGVSNMATAIAVVWQHLDAIYGASGSDQINVNAAFTELGLEYAAYLKAGGSPLLDVITKYIADGADAGMTPDRMQSLHDNLLSNLTDYALHQRYDAAGLYNQMHALVDATDTALLTRASVGGYETDAAGSASSAHTTDVQNGYAAHVSGQLTATDVDNNDAGHLTWAITGTSSYGTMAIDATTGKWTYTLDDTLPATEALGAGETVTQTFTATVSDAHGGSASQTVTITINGTNDAPVITNTAADAKAAVYVGGGLDHVVTADVAGDHKFEIDQNIDGKIATLLGATPSDIHTVLLGVQAALGHAAGFADAIAAVWDYVDDHYSYYDTAINAIGVRLAIEYAKYLQGGGEPLTGIVVKYTADGADAGTAPDRAQSMHDNLLGNLDAASIDDKFLPGGAGGSNGGANGTADVALHDALIAEIAAAGLTGRPYYGGYEGTDPSASQAWDAAHGLTGGTHQIISGQLTATDVDTNDAGHLTWSLDTTATPYGTMAINATTGVWTYDLDNSLAATKALAAGETVTQTFIATVTDAHGGSASETVTITITGANDAPVITSGASAAMGFISEAGDLASIHDAGIGGPLLVDPALAANTAVVGALATLDGQLGSLPSQSNVHDVLAAIAGVSNMATAIAVVWQNLDAIYGSAGPNQVNVNAAFTELGLEYAAYLKAGGSPLVDVVAKYIADGADAGTTPDRSQSLHDNLLNNLTDYALHQRYDATGLYTQMHDLVAAQNAALLTRASVGGYEADAPGSASSAHTTDMQNGYAAHVSGQLAATDVDHGTTQTWSITGPATYGTMEIDATGKWTYTLDDKLAATDSLAHGESVTQTFTATVTDDHGATDTVNVTVTINGTNDAPVITSSTASVTLFESGGLNNVVTADVAADHRFDPAHNVDGTAALSIGTGINTEAAMKAVVTAVQSALGGGATEADAIAAVWDYLDDARAAISGVEPAYYATSLNKAGVLLGLVYGDYLEHGGRPLVDVIVKYTPDGGDADTAPDRVQSLHDNLLGAVDTPSINDKFSSDPTLLADLKAQILAAGLTDRPIYSGNEGDTNNALAWDQAHGFLPSATGQLTATDADHGAVLTWSINGPATYGVMAIDAVTGIWSYTLDNSLTATQALAEGQTVTQTYTATVTDEHGATASQTVAVTIHGTNDAPVINYDFSGPYASAEDTAIHLTQEQLNWFIATYVSDADNSNSALTYTYSIGGQSISFTGSAPAGGYTFTPTENFNGTLQGFFSVSDGQSITTKTFSYDVTPVNDAPVINFNLTGIYSSPEDTQFIVPKSVIDGFIQSYVSDVETPNANLHFTFTIGTSTIDFTGAAPADGLSYTPDANYNGPVSGVFSVSDGNITTTQNVVLTITPVNDAPTDIALSNLSVASGAAGAVIGDISVADVDDTTFTFVVKNGDGSVNNNLTVTGSAGHYQLVVTSGGLSALPPSVSVTATDSGGLSVTEAFALTLPIQLFNASHQLIGSFATIQAAVNGAHDGVGDYITLPAGTYNENVIINKGVDIVGAEHGVAGDAAGRGGIGESVINGQWTIDTTHAVKIDGLYFNNTSPSGNGADATLSILQGGDGAGHVVTDTVFYSSVAGGDRTTRDDRAIYVGIGAGTGHITIDDNLITGSSDGKYGTASWGRGIWADTTSGLDLTISDNTFHNVRSGLNLDDYGATNPSTHVTGNDFTDTGTAVALGVNWSGDITALLHANSFDNVDQEINIKGLSHDVTLDAGAGVGGYIDGTVDDAVNDAFYISGGSGGDTITGTDYVDVIEGLNGADTIKGGKGDDVIFGGAGIDTAKYDATLATSQITANGSGGWTVTTGTTEGTDSLFTTEIVQGAGAHKFLLVGNGGFATIQAAIDASSNGDTILIAAGTYVGNINVNKEVTIIGSGALTVIQGTFLTDNHIIGTVETFLQSGAGYTAASGAGFTVAADNVSITNLSITGFNVGIELNGGATNTTLDGTAITNVAITSVIDGIHKTDTAGVNGLTITGGSITDGHIGIDFAKSITTSDGYTTHVTITGTSFSHLTEKGIYVESFDQSTISNITMTDVGEIGRTAAFGLANQIGDFGAGIDINLKNGSYKGIVIDGFTFINVGDANSGGHGIAIGVKVRNDGNYAGAPATYNGVVTIENGSIDDTSTGVRIGEPGQSTTGINVDLTNVAITDATYDGDNATTATLKVTMPVGVDSLFVVNPATTIGAVNITGNDLGDTITTGGGADTVFGGTGNDTITGGKGADVLHGGVGNDTFLYKVGDGADIIDGGSETGSTYPSYDVLSVTGDATARTFSIGKAIGGTDIVPLTGANATDIAVSYDGSDGTTIRADEIERVTVTLGSGGDTVTIGDITGTAIAPSTIVVTGGAGADTLNLAHFIGDTSIMFSGGGGVDKIDFGSIDWKSVTVTTDNGGHFVIVAGGHTFTVDTVENFTFANGTATASQLLEVAPTDIIAGTLSVAENAANGTAVGSVSAVDGNGSIDVLSYAFMGNNGEALGTSADGRFKINTATGQITVANGTLLDYEATGSHSHTETVVVTDSHGQSYSEQVTISLTDVNEAPVITSNGGGTAATISVAENSTYVTTVTSTDPDLGATKTYSISGTDAGFFKINSSTGELSFNTAPDYETPKDSGHGNTYDIQVNVTDGSLTDSQAIAVKVTDVDEVAPKVTVHIVDSSMDDANTTSVVNFTFSEGVSDFDLTDATVVGGLLSNLTGSGTSYSATFTATDGFSGTGSVSVGAGTYHDAAGNIGVAGADNVSIDRLNPAVTVAFGESTLNDGNRSSLVSFTFSENVTDFSLNDVSVQGGSITGLIGIGKTYWATFTANDGFSGTGSVTVDAGSYHDAADNSGVGGSDTVSIDRVNPTVAVNIVDANLTNGDPSSVVNFTFSESVSDFGLNDVKVAGGTLSNLTGSGTSYSATFTASTGYAGTGSVSVDAGKYHDAVGNDGLAGSDTVGIDRVSPTVAVNIVDTKLSDGDATSVVNFTFSESVTDFGLTDITVAGGTLSNLTGSGTSYSATFTATDGFSGTGAVSVNASSYHDAAGNNGASGSDTVAIDRLNPTVAVNIVDANLTNGDPSSVVNFTFSESVTDFGLNDVTVVGGTLSNLTGSGTSYSATFTASTGYVGTGSVSIDAGKYHDAAGNDGVAGSDTAAIDRSNTAPVAVGETILVNYQPASTGYAALGIPNWLLLLNDSDAESTVSVSAVTGFSDLQTAILQGNQVVIQNNSVGGHVDSDWGSFTYQITDGTDTASATATIVVGGYDENVNGIGAVYGDGTDGDDIMYNVFPGTSAILTLNGGNGNDILVGNTGRDELNGGSGDDILIGGAGSDHINGGSGFDIASYVNSSAAVQIHLDNSGNAENNYIGNGNPGAGYVGGDALGDDLTGIEGLAGGSGNDYLAGNSSANTLYGNGGNDTLVGEGGNDILVGGQGSDSLSGGSGNDTFRWMAGDLNGGGVDSILDFDKGNGSNGDIIDLSNLLGSIASADRASHVRFEDSAHNVTYANNTGATQLTGDIMMEVDLGHGAGWQNVASIHGATSAGGGGNDVIKMILDNAQAQVQVHV